ncbi:YitT family protein [Faecalibaculum rodentium]|uniref:YitT family protein n=1 Tax=Faecalibaculum rodentium TaxID=1702221 RepID=UPI001F574E4B|nr:YitT family protein [Faecalibaculum rodentium]
MILEQFLSPQGIRDKRMRFVASLLMIVASSLLQTYVIQTFMDPCDLLSSGFTGVAILLNRIAGLAGFDFSTSLGILLLNIPAAMFCAGKISKRFVFLSCVQFTLTSLFLEVLHFPPLFDEMILNVIFGGFLYGFVSVIALKADGSTGGTDFIAMYVSERFHRGIWEYVFAFNVLILLIFGSMFGWAAAGYSILFQLISTQTISRYYHRYSQILVEITTKDPEQVAKQFKTYFRHGMTVIPAYGAYSQSNFFLCKSIVSSYEEREVIERIREVDPECITYTHKVDHFYGRFYRRPIE